MLFEIAQKSPNIWDSFARKFVAENLPKSPNRVALVKIQIKMKKVQTSESTISQIVKVDYYGFSSQCSGHCYIKFSEDSTETPKLAILKGMVHPELHWQNIFAIFYDSIRC